MIYVLRRCVCWWVGRRVPLRVAWDLARADEKIRRLMRGRRQRKVPEWVWASLLGLVYYLGPVLIGIILFLLMADALLYLYLTKG